MINRVVYWVRIYKEYKKEYKKEGARLFSDEESRQSEIANDEERRRRN